MRLRLTALIVLAALLAPPFAVFGAVVTGETASHACCPERLAANCQGPTIACCRSENGPARPATVPAAATSAGTTTQVPSFEGAPSADPLAAACVTTRLAHAAAARLHTPSDPLFLKNLVLLV